MDADEEAVVHDSEALEDSCIAANRRYERVVSGETGIITLVD